MTEQISYKKSSFLGFAFAFGLKYVRRETLRIMARMLLEGKRNRILLAKNAAGKIVGYIVARPCPKKYAFAEKGEWMVGPCYVLPAYRGHGIGTELLLQMENLCHSKKYCAYVLVQNIGSCAALEKAGYEKIGFMKQGEDGKFSLADNGNFYVFRKEVATS